MVLYAEVVSEQKNRLIKLTVETESKSELLLDSFTGTEAISELFSFELSLLSNDADLELKTLIGKPTLLEIRLADGEHRYIHGHITRFSHEGREGKRARYSATLSPWLWNLTRRADLRIFQDKTVLDVVDLVFRYYAPQARYRFDVFDQDSLKRHSCITQFNETDEQFFRRLLEEKGLFFYFEHSSEGHTLVVANHSRGLKPLEQQPTIHYLVEDVPSKDDTISEWRSERHLATQSVCIPSFNYKFARDSRTHNYVRLQYRTECDDYSLYEFAGQYTSDFGKEYESIAQKRSVALHALRKTFEGTSNCRAMLAGYTFTFEDHYRHPDYRRNRSAVRDFLLLRVQHTGHNNYLNQDKPTYRNSFTCIRKDIPYYPLQTHPRPIIAGPLTAIVVGPDGVGEVYTDEWGRVKVRFHWQWEQRENDSSLRHSQDTAWLRVAQPSAGDGFGHQFLPRIGQEVVVSFVAGDASMPLITGAVYNNIQRVARFSGVNEPLQLPNNRGLSGIKTKEHAGNGYSELVFDDTPGSVRSRLASTHQNSALNLGRLTTPRSQGEADPKGEGVELRTDAAIALRAAHGLLLTTHAQHQAKDDQLGRDELLDLLKQCANLFQSLGQTAVERGGQVLDHEGLEGLRTALQQWPTPDSSSKGEPLIAMTSEAGIVSATPRSQAHYAGENHDTTAQDHLQLTSGAGMRLHSGKGISAFAQDGGISAIANRGKVLVQAQDDNLTLNAQKGVQVMASENEVLISGPTIRFVADDGSYIKIGGGVEIGTASKVRVHAEDVDWQGPKTDKVASPEFGRSDAEQRHQLHYVGDSTAAALGQTYKIGLEDGSTVQGITDVNGLAEWVNREAMQHTQLGVLARTLVAAAGGGVSPDASDKPEDSTQDASLYSQTFLIKDQKTGLPRAGVKYRIELDSGDVVVGMTDEHGQTQPVRSNTPQFATIKAPHDDNIPPCTYSRSGSDTYKC